MIQVQIQRAGEWRNLTSFPYEGGSSREKDRKAAIDQARICAANWTHNYDSFAGLRTRLVDRRRFGADEVRA